MGKKILVTGAGGFIGTALVSLLSSKQDISVLGLSRRRISSEKFHSYQVDLINNERLKAVLKKERPDCIYHLAGGRSGDPAQLFRDNIATTINLFETIRSLNDYHPRVVIAGSAAEYGNALDSKQPISEESATSPMGIYGWIKLLQTQTGLYYAGIGENVVIVRIFNILGPGIQVDMAAGRFAQELVRLEKVSGAKLLSTGSLDAVRDFLDIRDICEALFLLSYKGKKGEIYNICSQNGIGMRELVKVMISTCGQKGIKIKENKKNKPGVIYAIGSNLKLKKATGWKAEYSLSQSIKDTLVHYHHENHRRT